MSSGSLNLQRQSGLIPPELVQAQHITVIGAGAIGSSVAESLAKIGISKLTLWDYDTVEDHNLPNQGFMFGDIGKPKVVALKDRLEAGTGVSINAKEAEFTSSSRLNTPVVISAVDSMRVRKLIWEKCKTSTTVRLFIDGRMGAMFGQIYAIKPGDVPARTYYEGTLFSDSEAAPLPCTEKATIFCAQGMSAFIASTVVDYILDQNISRRISVDFANKIAARG